jgi:hypothetical protein
MSSRASPPNQISPVGRILSAIFLAYLTNALLVTGTEQPLGRLLVPARFFVAELLMY